MSNIEKTTYEGYLGDVDEVSQETVTAWIDRAIEAFDELIGREFVCKALTMRGAVHESGGSWKVQVVMHCDPADSWPVETAGVLWAFVMMECNDVVDTGPFKVV